MVVVPVTSRVSISDPQASTTLSELIAPWNAITLFCDTSLPSDCHEVPTPDVEYSLTGGLHVSVLTDPPLVSDRLTRSISDALYWYVSVITSVGFSVVISWKVVPWLVPAAGTPGTVSTVAVLAGVTCIVVTIGYGNWKVNPSAVSLIVPVLYRR